MKWKRCPYCRLKMTDKYYYFTNNSIIHCHKRPKFLIIRWFKIAIEWLYENTNKRNGI